MCSAIEVSPEAISACESELIPTIEPSATAPTTNNNHPIVARFQCEALQRPARAERLGAGTLTSKLGYARDSRDQTDPRNRTNPHHRSVEKTDLEPSARDGRATRRASFAMAATNPTPSASRRPRRPLSCSGVTTLIAHPSPGNSYEESSWPHRDC